MRTPSDNNAQSVAQRIQAEREKLLGAAGIIACTIYACDLKLGLKRTRPTLLWVLAAAQGIVNDSAARLGEFCDQLKKRQRESK